jgi:hypothetical protein
MRIEATPPKNLSQNAVDCARDIELTVNARIVRVVCLISTIETYFSVAQISQVPRNSPHDVHTQLGGGKSSILELGNFIQISIESQD